MSDQNGEQLVLATAKERAVPLVAAIYGRRGLLDETGEVDRHTFTDIVLELVLTAFVDQPKERANVAITRPQYMARLFPEVPNEAAWPEQEDPEVAAEVYNQIDTAIWRLLDVAPSGPIQSRLNGEQGLMLCVQKQKTRRPAAVYVTRNAACIVDDVQGPANKSLERAALRAASLATLAIERVPEHGGKFGRTYGAAANLAITTGKAKVKAALEAAKNAGETDDGGDE
jgi:hypothetical protein